MIDEMKRQKRELVYKGSILDIYKDTMQFANGKTEEWDFVSHRKGAAAVLPVLDDGRIIMVRQYRNALERETIEIPAGCRDFVGEEGGLAEPRRKYDVLQSTPRGPRRSCHDPRHHLQLRAAAAAAPSPTARGRRPSWRRTARSGRAHRTAGARRGAPSTRQSGATAGRRQTPRRRPME